MESVPHFSEITNKWLHLLVSYYIVYGFVIWNLKLFSFGKIPKNRRPDFYKMRNHFIFLYIIEQSSYFNKHYSNKRKNVWESI